MQRIAAARAARRARAALNLKFQKVSADILNTSVEFEY
jgi:hypothetical protein